jgi:C4-dicarboxylate-specific signal transduction histidine kinase
MSVEYSGDVMSQCDSGEGRASRGPGHYCLLDTPEAKVRLAATTTMASTLANEINQPLSAAANYLYACARRLRSRGDDHADLLAMIEHASREMLKAGEIVRRVRSFIVSGRIAGSSENLRTMIERVTAALLLPGADEIEIVRTVPLDLYVVAERVQIEQVFSILLRNGSEALEGRPQPRIAIGASRQGGQVVIRIEDNGPGFPPEALERLFKPDFTTKASMVGLGLPICRAIVECHGGRIWSEIGASGGAVFNVALPAGERPLPVAGDGR